MTTARTIGSILVCAVALAGCRSTGNGSGSDAPAATQFTLRDTTDYETFAGGGRYALLYHDGALTDTVDLAFGVPATGEGSILFLPVSRSHGDPPAEDWFGIEHHVMFDGEDRTPLGDLVPYFNPGFSSPAVPGKRLYYWGIRPSDGMLYAMRYDFGDAGLDSTSLGDEVLGTDFRFNLRPPELAGDVVVFRGQGTRWELSVSEFEVVRRATATDDN